MKQKFLRVSIWLLAMSAATAAWAQEADPASSPLDNSNASSASAEASADLPVIPLPEKTDTGGMFRASDISFNFSGFTRVETAIRATGSENPYNQKGNLFNGKPTSRCGGPPPYIACTFADQATRTGENVNNEFNLMQLRTHLDFQAVLSSTLTFRALARGVFDIGKYDTFDPSDVSSEADGHLYGKPNYFEYGSFNKGGCQDRLELCGRQYMVDLPVFTLDYQNGPLLIRAGNQQIAWGQALFFRVLDVPNGLDLRRHLFIDYTPEEYADERISAPGIRTSYQISNEWEADSFVQMFAPTLYPNPNTPYNVIASQFTVHDRYNDVNNKLNYGLRLRGSINDVGLQFVYANRINPDGVFHWTKSNVNRNLPGELPNLPLVNIASNAVQAILPNGVAGTGLVLAQTAFEVDPTGVVSANEWFTYAGMARLNAVEGLNSSITEFPATALLGALPVENNEQAMRELDLFFQLSGGLRGHIARQYHRENNIGFGTSYVVSAEPDTILDQLIINFEALYTPDRTFTSPSLSANSPERGELVTALVMEKYQRFSQSFPATYMVFQWEHRTESDLYGRLLDGMNGTSSSAAGGYKGGWDGLVFAFQQPFPSLVYRLDGAVLYDTRGGLLTQFGLRWKPSGPISAELYYTYLNGKITGNSNDNIISTIDYADEVGVRLGYQF